MSNGSRRARAVLPIVGLVAGLLSVAPAAQATFPGDNGKVVFQAAPPPASGQMPVNDIYVANEDGSGVTNLTNNSANDAYPSWSPDGSQIAFVSDRNSGDGTTNLYLMDADGSDVTPLPAISGDQGWTAWSPDGSKLAFSTGNSSISVLNLNTGDITALASGWHPNWSPDGSTIAYINQIGEQVDIFKISAAGGAATNLTNTSGDSEYAPNYSPDGSKILFSVLEGNDYSTSDVDLYTMTPSGGSRTEVVTGAGWQSEPTWSPDGTKVVYTHNTDPVGGGNSVLLSSSANGSGTAAFASVSGASIDHPDWQPLGGGPSERTDVSRKVTLKAVAKGTKLILKGKITSVDMACNTGQSVAVQKLKSGSFKTLATVTSNDSGVYKKAVKKAKGKYRAVVSASQTSSSNCLEATSKTVKFPS